jgi:hypothetical protein
MLNNLSTAAIFLLIASITSPGLASPSEAGQAGSEGSNLSGTERTCGKAARTVGEAFSGCKRGDIIGLTLVPDTGVVSALCDFTKTILYSRGEPVACVYTGAIRQGAK